MLKLHRRPHTCGRLLAEAATSVVETDQCGVHDLPRLRRVASHAGGAFRCDGVADAQLGCPLGDGGCGERRVDAKTAIAAFLPHGVQETRCRLEHAPSVQTLGVRGIVRGHRAIK